MTIPDNIVKEITQVKSCYFKDTGITNLFSWKELEFLLNLRPFANDTRFKITNSEKLKLQNQAWVSDPNSYPPSVIDKLIKKHHAYFSDCSRVNKKINSICNELERIFPSGAADAHIYFDVSEKFNDGFGIHWDYSHNLIIQVEGSTRFQIWEKKTPFLKNINPSYNIPAFIDVVLQPGDAIFVPMYVYHQALSNTKRLSISFPVNWMNTTINTQDRHWIQLDGNVA